VLIQEEKGGDRLILGRGRDVLLDRQMGEKRCDLFPTQQLWVPLAVKENVPAYP
jgi:hypothetical protein